MRLRHIAVMVVLVLLLVAGVAPSASSAPSPEAALKSLFNTWATGAEATAVATFEHGSEAWFHTATNAAIFDTFDIPGEPNSGIGAVRLSPVPGWPSGPGTGRSRTGSRPAAVGNCRTRHRTGCSPADGICGPRRGHPERRPASPGGGIS